MTETAIVVVAHAMAMGAGVVDDDEVAHFDFRQFSLDSKFVAVFAKRTGHIIDMVLRCIGFAKDGDVVVRAIHARAHEVSHASVGADVVSVNVLVVQGFGHQEAEGAGHHAAAFEGNTGMVEACHLFFEKNLRTFAEAFQIHRILLRTVRNADAAAEVDEGDGDTLFSLDFIGQVKHHADGAQESRELQFSGNDHGVDTDVGNPFFFRPVHAGHELVLHHAVLGFFRCADNGIAASQVRARVVAEADFLRDDTQSFQVCQVGHIIEIDDGAQFIGFQEFFIRCIVGREYNVVAGDAHGFRQHQFSHGAAVCANAQAF